MDFSKYPAELKPAVQKYEDFIRNKLEPDLSLVIEARDAIYTQMSEYLKLKTHIDTIRTQKLDELETKVDLGSNFYAKAFVPDTTHIFVSVGFGFHLEMTLDEADKFIDQKIAHMEK
ncbi:hypothetical protein H4S08_001184 [Coemansia sp. RSA 1365]|nr:hypothetical protein H4S08_001184 [Coemansia sp. RSA 1365]